MILAIGCFALALTAVVLACSSGSVHSPASPTATGSLPEGAAVALAKPNATAARAINGGCDNRDLSRAGFQLLCSLADFDRFREAVALPAVPAFDPRFDVDQAVTLRVPEWNAGGGIEREGRGASPLEVSPAC